jgi:phage terminase large subunit GpA-like protein
VEYLDQLTAERPKLEMKNGKRSRKWVLPPGKRNEALDCWVYSYAALRVLGLKFYNELGDRAKKLASYDPQEPAEDVVTESAEDRELMPYELPKVKKVKKKGLTVHRPSSFNNIFR